MFRQMIPLRFGTVDRPTASTLAGVFHPGQISQASKESRTESRTAVLLCPPFGQEAVRTHRLYRVLAERVARAGLACLRFDYVGTGDSDGDDLEGSMQRWRLNILDADAELRRRALCDRVIWVGARLGATLAIQAAMDKAVKPPSRVLAWEPVIDGDAYLRELASEHVKALGSPYRKPVTPAANRPLGEALGFGMSETLIEEISRIHADKLLPPQPSLNSSSALTVIADPAHASLQQWVRRLIEQGQASDWQDLAIRFEWTAEEAMNTSLVPQAALQCLLGRIQEASA